MFNFWSCIKGVLPSVLCIMISSNRLLKQSRQILSSDSCNTECTVAHHYDTNSIHILSVNQCLAHIITMSHAHTEHNVMHVQWHSLILRLHPAFQCWTLHESNIEKLWVEHWKARRSLKMRHTISCMCMCEYAEISLQWLAKVLYLYKYYDSEGS